MWYEDVAKVYGETYGEPLVADEQWVKPLFEQVEIAVACQHDLGYDEFVGGAEQDEILRRTAAVIATMTYGVKEAALMRETTAARKGIPAARLLDLGGGQVAYFDSYGNVRRSK